MSNLKSSNLSQVECLLSTLETWQCREVIVCAGARNAPLAVALLKSSHLKVHSHFEERSAAFFAVGRIKSSGLPVAVLTTSGTAAAELLPAVIESHYSGLPLIVMTADRPKEYRGSGAPQSIEQVGLFSNYVEKCVDCVSNVDWQIKNWSEKRPIHINICLHETSRDELSQAEKIAEAWGRVESIRIDRAAKEDLLNENLRESFESFRRFSNRPAIVVGPLPAHFRSRVESWLIASGAPVYLESLSQLAGAQPLGEQKILGGEKSLMLALDRGWCDGIIRVGGVPTTRLWRDLESKYQRIPVVHFSHLPFIGLSRTDTNLFSIRDLLDFQLKFNSTERAWRVLQTEAQSELNRLKSKFPSSEVSLLGKLAESFPKSARVYLGNSLPIREWDLNSADIAQQWWVEGNRGANGIDGQVSTFLGFSENTDPNWGIIGDLTALYDLASFWSLKDRPLQNFNLVVVNNGGGRIFQRMFAREVLENSHSIKLSGWADLWNLNYEAWEVIPDFVGGGQGPRVIELMVNGNESAQFWNEWESWWQLQGAL